MSRHRQRGEVFTNRISNYVDRVDAFDISDIAIKRARLKFKNHKINFYVEDARNFTASKKYDLIFCFEMLYYLDNKEQKKLLGEVCKSLNQGGYLFYQL